MLLLTTGSESYDVSPGVLSLIALNEIIFVEYLAPHQEMSLAQS